MVPKVFTISQPVHVPSNGDSDEETIKVLLPRFSAAVVHALFHVVCGIALVYSAVIIPQLHMEEFTVENGTSNAIVLTETDSSWIASTLPMFITIGAIFCGPIMDTIGRLNVTRLALVPTIIGWTLIATATNVPMILGGRILTGFGMAWGMFPCMIYISEISYPKYRGALIALGPAFASVGMLLGYLEGWLFHWKLVAWASLAFAIVPVILMTWIPKSPQWLVSKGRHEEAKNALNWFNKYYLQPFAKTETQLDLLLTEHQQRQEVLSVEQNGTVSTVLKMYLQPTVYKPLLIMLGMFFFQQVSGVFMILFYAVTFFKEFGTDLDPFLVSVYIGVVRLLMSFVAVYLMRRFGKRSLLIVSGLGMSICMFVSGLYTTWIQEGSSVQTWVPVIMLLLYITSSMIGFLGIPLTIISELFPIKGRGVTQSTSVCTLYMLMFATTRSYYYLYNLCGGSAGLQYFFGIGSLLGVIYSYIFLPETHKKTLLDIEDFFKNYTIYLFYQKKTQKLSVFDQSPRSGNNEDCTRL